MIIIKIYLLIGLACLVYELVSSGYNSTAKYVYEYFNGIVRMWFIQAILLLFFVLAWPKLVLIFVETLPKRVRLMYLLWKVKRIKRKYNL